MTDIVTLPVSKMESYSHTFFLFSSLKPGWVPAFLEHEGRNCYPFGLEKKLWAPDGFVAFWYPSLSNDDEFIQRTFGFDPKTYLHIDGSHPSVGNPGHAKITEEGIKRFLTLCDREKAKTVLSPCGFNPRPCYCSENVLNR